MLRCPRRSGGPRYKIVGGPLGADTRGDEGTKSHRKDQGRGGWHDTWVFCCLQLAAPIGLSPLTAALPLNPLPL